MEEKEGMGGQHSITRRKLFTSIGSVFGAALSAGILSSVGCSRKDEFNLLFISLDTLRADHSSFLGYKRKTTPLLDRFAKDCLIFESMHTPSPWTDQSHATIFSSLYPRVHSISFTASNKLRFSIASILKKKDYTTAGFVESMSLDDRIGVSTGFDQWFNVSDPNNYHKSRAPDNNKRVFEWLDANYKKKFFLFVHYFDIHYPYLPPAPWDKLYTSRYDQETLALGSIPNRVYNPSPEHLEQAIALYDAEISYTDYHFNILLSRLDDLGLIDRTIIVVFSDHGEGFMEHGLMNHGNSLYQELLHVPAVIRFPDGFGAGEIVSGVTRTLDITPTVLDYLGIETSEPFQGTSLLPMIRSGEKRDLLFYADGIRYAMSVRARNWKLIHNHSFTPEISKKLGVKRPVYELYNLKSDPGEKNNLAQQKPDVVEKLMDRIKSTWELNRRWKKGFIQGERKGIDKDLEEGLRRLGYIN